LSRAAISLSALATSSACARLSSAQGQHQRQRQCIAEARLANGDDKLGAGSTFVILAL